MWGAWAPASFLVHVTVYFAVPCTKVAATSYLNMVLSGCTSATEGLGLYVNTSVDSLIAPSKYIFNGPDVPAGASVL